MWLVLAVGVAYPNVAAADWRVATGFDASTGTYGLGDPTDVAITFFEVGASTGLWNAQITVPYLGVEGPAEFGLPNLPPEEAENVTGRDQTWGLGDVRLGVSRFFPLRDGRALLDISAAAKLPTADPDRLLGTGKADVTLRTDYIQDVGSFTVLAGLGYTFSGRSEQFDVQDRAEFSVGVLREFSGLPTLGVTYAHRSAVISGLDDVRELSWSASFPVGDHVSMITYALTGFSETSPDYGLGFRITYRP